jgi:ABC-type uncharacterized transport system fused permease/ATPase subunit
MSTDPVRRGKGHAGASRSRLRSPLAPDRRHSAHSRPHCRVPFDRRHLNSAAFIASVLVQQLRWTPLLLISRLLVSFSAVAGLRYVLCHLSLQLVVLLLLNGGVSSVFESLVLRDQSLEKWYQNSADYGDLDSHAEDGRSSRWEAFVSDVQAFFPLLCLYAFLVTVSSAVNTAFQLVLARRVKAALGELILTNHTADNLLLHQPEMSCTMPGLPADVDAICRTGCELFTSAATSLVNGMSAIIGLYRLSTPLCTVFGLPLPDLLLYSLAYAITTRGVSRMLCDAHQHFDFELHEQTRKWTLIRTHDVLQMSTVTHRGGESYLRNRYSLIESQIRRLENRVQALAALQAGLGTLLGLSGNLFRLCVFGTRSYAHRITSEQRSAALIKDIQLNEVISWYSEHYQTFSSLLFPFQNLEAVVAAARANRHRRSTQPSLTYHDRPGSGGCLTLRDVVIGRAMGEPPLLHIAKLDFRSGKRYGVSGGSGQGKTMLLRLIHRMNAPPGITFSARVDGPRSCRLLMLTQQDYFMKFSTLAEILLFPQLPPTDATALAALEARLKQLLLESGIQGCEAEGAKAKAGIVELLHESRDWDSRLSSGQKKKVQLLSAIVQQPDVLLMDEVFANMDAASIQTMQGMLLTHLPHCTIIAVDHQALENDEITGAHFYHQRLLIANQTCTIVTT